MTGRKKNEGLDLPGLTKALEDAGLTDGRHMDILCRAPQLVDIDRQAFGLEEPEVIVVANDYD